MKKLIFVGGIIAIFFTQSCQETIPEGLVLSQPFASVDSDYIITTIPTAQLKNILIEEFTGVTCSNCPKGAVDLAKIEVANAPRVLVAKIHNNVQAKPIKVTDPDLRCNDADAIASALGFVAKPSAAIDRLQNVGADYTFSISALAGIVSTQLTKTTPVNINISKLVIADTVNLETRLTFTDTTSKKLSYNIYLLEDDVEATQDSFDVANLSKIEIEDYLHEKILRKSITPVNIGTALPDVLQQIGKVYLRSIQFTKPSGVIKINNCTILVFVQNRETKEIIHCQKLKL
jgi:hypothetical protein